MSHNKLSIDNQEVSNVGNIPINLSSYISETTPSNNQVIKFDGVNWINSDSPAGTGFKAKASVFLNETAIFGGSGSYSIGNYLMIQKAGSRTNKIEDVDVTLNPATATNTIKSNSNWLESIDIPAGTFLCICTLAIENGDMKARWESDSGGFSHYVHVYANNNTLSSSLIVGVLNTTVANTVRIVVKDQSTASGLIDDGDHRALSVHILKLG